MSVVEALSSGLAGACALTAIHESARHAIPHAPRMDVLGKRALSATLQQIHREPPAGQLQEMALAGDIAANSLYYSLVALGDPATAPLRGAILGLAAGIGAVTLPGPMGLGTKPSSRTTSTAAMTIAWYFAGGLAAGLAYRCLADDSD